MGRRTGALLGTLLAVLAVAAPANAGWTRLSSQSDASSIVVPALFQLPSAQFVAAYRRTVAGNDNIVDTSQFGTTPAGAITGLAHHVAIGPLGNIDDPQLLPGAGGQPLLADSGIEGTPTGLDGTFYQQRGASGLFSLPVVVSGASTAGAPGPGVILRSGQPAIPSAGTGSLHVWVGSANPATDVDLTSMDVGTSYIPRLAFDRSGRLWLAWYVLPGTDAGKGIYLLQLDPTTAAAMPPVIHVPRSQSITNESLSIAMACNAICHVIYHETAADNVLDTGRIVSWAPNQGAPVPVAGVRGVTFGSYLSASATPAGNIWVAWHTPQDVYYAKRGNSLGAGGSARLLGQPPHTDLSGAFDLTTAPIGNEQLLVATNFSRTSGQFDVWATVARNFDLSGIPNPTVITDPTGAAIVPTKVTKVRGRCLPLKLQAYKPATLLAWIYVGRRGKVRLNPRKLIKHYRGPGIQKGCIRLPREPKGWYKARKFRLVVGFQAGFHPPRGAYTSTHSKLIKIKL
jgi:hypothetical protein